MLTYSYETVDVFTSTRFGGNPLAVILDARGLSDEQMQRIAIEFNYSETTFVLPPEDPASTARVRIFTPSMEVPFAGHPNVGTAFVLARRGELFGRPVGDQMRFEELAGPVSVTVEREGGAVSGAEIRAPRPLELGDSIDPAVLAACVSLSPADIRSERHAPRSVSVGLPFLAAELASRAALARAIPNPARCAEAAEARGIEGGLFALFLYVPDAANAGRVSARMFAPLDGVAEDPATGSASAALGAYLAALLPAPDAELAITIDQGVDMGRPSELRVRANKRGGVVGDVWVAGGCVPVMRGAIDL